MTFNLPRGYLSHSAMVLWETNKDQYRRRYYLNEAGFSSIETEFGHEVHKKFEEDESIVGSETEMKIEVVKGLFLLGKIDSFNDKTLEIIDFKTGHLNKKGEAPWDRVKVQKHKQLVFYSLLVLSKYGKYNRTAILKWYETKFQNKFVEYKGRKLEMAHKKLELTGKELVFKRKVYKWEILALKKDIIRTALEISKDYTLWQQKNNKSVK